MFTNSIIIKLGIALFSEHFNAIEFTKNYGTFYRYGNIFINDWNFFW